jgi:hypothetical protein
MSMDNPEFEELELVEIDLDELDDVVAGSCIAA